MCHDLLIRRCMTTRLTEGRPIGSNPQAEKTLSVPTCLSPLAAGRLPATGTPSTSLAPCVDQTLCERHYLLLRIESHFGGFTSDVRGRPQVGEARLWTSLYERVRRPARGKPLRCCARPDQ